MKKTRKYRVPKRTRYVVAFKVVTQFGSVQHQGEIDFLCYDESNLGISIRGALGIIGRSGKCPRQYKLSALATQLWRKKEENGEARIEIPVPRDIVEQQHRGAVTHRDVAEYVADLTCTCENPAECVVK